MVRFIAWLFFLGIATTVLMGFTAGGDEPPVRQDLGSPMPQVLYSEHSPPGFARWVSAAEAFGPSGVLDERLFHPQILDNIEDLLSQPPGEQGCIHHGPAYFDLVGAPDWGTPAKVLKNSELIVQGTVVGKEYGFKGSIPGQLLELRADHVYKGPEEYLDSYYVFFPVGEFEVGEVRLCKVDPRFPPPPEVGDELVVSVPYRNEPAERLLEPDLFSAQAYVTIKNGKAHWSPGLQMEDTRAVAERAELLELARPNHRIRGAPGQAPGSLR